MSLRVTRVTRVPIRKAEARTLTLMIAPPTSVRGAGGGLACTCQAIQERFSDGAVNHSPGFAPFSHGREGRRGCGFVGLEENPLHSFQAQALSPPPHEAAAPTSFPAVRKWCKTRWVVRTFHRRNALTRPAGTREASASPRTRTDHAIVKVKVCVPLPCVSAHVTLVAPRLHRGHRNNFSRVADWLAV